MQLLDGWVSWFFNNLIMRITLSDCHTSPSDFWNTDMGFFILNGSNCPFRGAAQTWGASEAGHAIQFKRLHVDITSIGLDRGSHLHHIIIRKCRRGLNFWNLCLLFFPSIRVFVERKCLRFLDALWFNLTNRLSSCDGITNWWIQFLFFLKKNLNSSCCPLPLYAKCVLFATLTGKTWQSATHNIWSLLHVFEHPASSVILAFWCCAASAPSTFLPSYRHYVNLNDT